MYSGPCEIISQNLGSLSEALIPVSSTDRPDWAALSSRKRQIQIFGTINTLSRLVVGWASDYTCPTSYVAASTSTLPLRRRWTTPRLTYLQLSAALLIFASFHIAFFIISTDGLWVLSACVGCSYGIVSVIGPSLVSKIWGEQDFGRNFGVFGSSKNS